MRTCSFAVALTAASLAATAALADRKTFDPSGPSGDFHEAANWDPLGIPDADDRIIIPKDKTCNVWQDATVDTIEVQSDGASDGWLEIKPGVTLTLENDDDNCGLAPNCNHGAQNSLIDGTVYIWGDHHGSGPGVLAITTASHQFNGVGEVTADASDAEITVASGLTLTNNLDTKGINGDLTIAGLGTFNNIALVNGNKFLYVASAVVDDAPGARWMTGCGDCIIFETGSVTLDGDFTEDDPDDPGAGTFVFKDDVKTCGAYERDCGSITLENNATFKYATFVDLSNGECGNPGIGQQSPGSCSDPWIVGSDVTGNICGGP